MRLFLLAALALAAGSAAAQPPSAASDTLHPYRPGVDVADYAIALELPDTGRVVRGRATITARVAPALDTLVLDLVGLQVDSVLLGGRPAPFARDSATLRVALGSAHPARVAVTVVYGGAVTDGLIVRTDSLGRWTGFGDNWPRRARYWIPSVDDPSDKATVAWTVTAPAARTVIANGRLEGRAARAGGRAVTTWRETRPVPTYVMVIAAAPLVSLDLGDAACGRAEAGRCVRQTAYVAPEQRAALPGPFRSATAIVDYFSRLVAPFPYEKLAHLQSSTRFGGMENASAIFYADAPYRSRTMRDGVVAHETAHQWFGDAVTERAFSHLWLSEGFATYWAALWLRKHDGETAFRDEMRRTREQIARSEVTWARPVIDTAETDDLRLLNTNSYEKGGWVLHMLRAELGDSAFFRGVRSYYAAHRHGTALTDDLRRELERASGRELASFFDQWLRRPGMPQLTTGASYDAATRRVTLTVDQGDRGQPYAFPLTVEIEDAGGRIARTVVQVGAAARTRLVLPLDVAGPPRRVTMDPDVALLATFAR